MIKVYAFFQQDNTISFSIADARAKVTLHENTNVKNVKLEINV